jgi:prefoldin subunit 5
MLTENMTTEQMAVIGTLIVNAGAMVYNAGKLGSTVEHITKAINALKSEVRQLNESMHTIALKVNTLETLKEANQRRSEED